MKHPPYSSELEKLYPEMIYSDIYMDYPIGQVVRYWTKLLLDNHIRLDRIRVDENGWDGDFHRIHHKTFPWAVDILHMYSSTFTSMKRIDSYKINFNLECREIIEEYVTGDSVMLTENGGVCLSRRKTGVIGYKLSEIEREYLCDLFRGDWVDYLDIQGSRIIVQFWLEDYYPIFRKEKILKIQNNLLSL